MIEDGFNSFWSICITWQESGDQPASKSRQGNIDYRDVLSPDDFALYAQLRSLRQQLAKQHGVPAYALFTNQQLADMVQRRVITLGALRELDGVGEARIEKYGQHFIALIQQQHSDQSAESVDETHPD